MEVIRNTYSVCPVCLQRIPAQHVRENNEIFLKKSCPTHGDFSCIIWRGRLPIEAWRGPLPEICEGENENCPHHCGLCDEHKQGTCCVVLEVTDRCNLGCTYCFADPAGSADASLEQVTEWLRDLIEPGQTLVQLSGGEPTVRDDLPEIVRRAKSLGAAYVQLNTNGLRLAEDEDYAATLAQAGLSFVFLQFDAAQDDSVYRALRGRPLLSEKLRAIENCARCGLGVTLVPTLVRGVNLDEIGPILQFAIAHSPTVRGVHFQPVSYFGRVPTMPDDAARYTLDELVDDLVRQSDGLLRMQDIAPSRCDHPLCGFHGDFIVLPDNRLLPLTKSKVQNECSCSTPEQNRAFVSRRWERSTGDMKIESGEEHDIHSFDGFLKRARTHGFTITSMPFQDRWNLDLERLRQCSLHVYDRGRWVPFCSYYLGGPQ
ncbi:MAG: radical SAM protein [Oscillospiraceae bacterium]